MERRFNKRICIPISLSFERVAYDNLSLNLQMDFINGSHIHGQVKVCLSQQNSHWRFLKLYSMHLVFINWENR